MADTRDLTVRIKGDTSEFERSMRQAGSAAEGGTMSFLKLSGAIAAGQAIYAAASAAFHFVSDQIQETIKSAEEAQNVQAQLEAALKSTGGAAGLTAKALEDQANALMRVTTFSDEQIKSAEALLLTFTAVHGAVYKQAIPAILDMATAMHEDLQSATVQVGKALNDPITGMTALRRVGVTFNDQQKEQIKSMEQANNLAGAQAIILKELQKEFGGSAEAAGHTFAGSLERLKNMFDEMRETVGTTILEAIQPFVEKLANFVDSDGFQQWIKNTVMYMRMLFDVITGTGTAVDGTEPKYAAVLNILMAIRKVITGELIPAVQAFVGQVVTLAEQVYKFLEPSLAALWSTIQKDLMPALIKLWKEVIVPLAPIIGVILVAATWLLVNVLTILVKVASEIITIFSEVVNAIIKVDSALIKFYSSVYSIIWNALKPLRQEVAGIVGDIYNWLYKPGQDLINGFINGIKSMIGQVITPIKNVGASAVTAMKNALGIHSPSTVFAEIGSYMGQGLVQGLQGEIGNVQASVSTLAGGSTQTASQSATAAVQSTPAPAAAPINITVAPQIGMYAGMPVEKRQIAVELWLEIVRAARAQGVQLPNINVPGVQA